VASRDVDGPLAHEIAKLLLEKAGTFLERKEAIESALRLGMPLNEIEEYLDWLDSIGRTAHNDDSQSDENE
jgi:hypothetical protein